MVGSIITFSVVIGLLFIDFTIGVCKINVDVAVLWRWHFLFTNKCIPIGEAGDDSTYIAMTTACLEEIWEDSMFLHTMKRAGFFPDTTVGFVVISVFDLARERETIQDETKRVFGSYEWEILLSEGRGPCPSLIFRPAVRRV